MLTKQANEEALNELAEADSVEEVVKAMNVSIINFASGSSAIPADAEPVLEKAAEVLKAQPEIQESRSAVIPIPTAMMTQTKNSPKREPNPSKTNLLNSVFRRQCPKQKATAKQIRSLKTKRPTINSKIVESNIK